MIKGDTYLNRVMLLSVMLTGLLFANGKLSVHGYLNQAFAISKEREFRGIPVEGTTDYRNLALQFRYDQDQKSIFIIQLSHRRLGVSPIMAVEEDVRLDWAFFEYRFQQQTKIKAGKIQLPFGIFNEIRDVGTLLPFYKVPVSFYGEDRHVSETIDGIAFSHTSDRLAPWEFSFDLFAGNWTSIEWRRSVNPLTGAVSTSIGYPRVENAIGGRLWVTSPIDWARFGGGALQATIKGGLTFSENSIMGNRDVRLGILSAELTPDRCYLRGEYTQFRFSGTPAHFGSWYLNGGFEPLPHLSVNLQTEVTDLRNLHRLFTTLPAKSSYRITSERTAGIAYQFDYSLVAKAEMHWNYSYDTNNGYMTLLNSEPRLTRYLITSVSISF